MAYRIRCKPTHPHGPFRRGGVLYNTDGVVVDQVPAAVADELALLGAQSWIEVEEVPEPSAGDGAVELGAASPAQEGDEDLLDFPMPRARPQPPRRRAGKRKAE